MAPTSVLTSRTTTLLVAGPAPEHRDRARDRRRLKHGQDIHRHGLRRARSEEPDGYYEGEKAGVSSRYVYFCFLSNGGYFPC